MIRFSQIRKYHILITGSSGFIGSKSVAALANRNHKICGIDIKSPSKFMFDISAKNPNIKLITADINNKESLMQTLNKYIDQNGNLDYIIHYASYWNYKLLDDIGNYQLNITSTKNLLDIANKYKIKRFIFASSVEALPSVGTNLDCFRADQHIHPYGWSKAVIENFLINNGNNGNNISIVRIGGVFSDWCELPPLYWLINRWSQDNILGRIIPGAGLTGIPFIHRDDLIELMEKIMDRNDRLDKCDIFMAAGVPKGSLEISTTHIKLFSIIRNQLGLNAKPVMVNKNIVKLGLLMENMIGMAPSEQAWMLRHVDSSNLDTEHIKCTAELLDWTQKIRIEDHLPFMLKSFVEQKEKWYELQIKRENHDYSYDE